jgi:dUTP pyrophosphatase
VSGGFFDYKQSYFTYVAEDIEQLLEKDRKNFEYSFSRSKKLEGALQKAKKLCSFLYEYVHNIDYYLESDNGPVEFDETTNELDRKFLEMNTENINVKVKRLTETAQLPVYATDGSGAFDLYADGFPDFKEQSFGDVAEYMPLTISTGLSFEIPKGYGMFILSRSGHGFNNQISLVNKLGLIDSDYRGQVMVKLETSSKYNRLRVNVGDRIAQAVIIKLPTVAFEEVDDLSVTERGTGGFGSTGIK